MDPEAFSVICKACGLCCQDHPFVKLTRDEVETIAAFTGLSPREFCMPIGGPGEGHFLTFDDQDRCVFLVGRPGAYSCSIYEVRARVCRDYPSSAAQISACKENQKRLA